MGGAMNEEDALTLEELERDIETLQEFLKAEEPEAAVFEEPEKVEEPPAVVEAPKPKTKSKPKPKAKKVEEKKIVEPVKAEVPVRLYGAAKLRAKRGR